MTEKQLLEGCKRGDHKAQRQLYDTYAGKMFGVCSRYVNDRETARDLLHDGFITIYSKIGDFRGDGSLEGWIRRIFVTTALGYLRKNRKMVDVDDEKLLYNLQSPDASVIEELSAEDLVKTMSKMSDGYRTVLNLYAVEGYSHNEIAQMLGISDNTSRSQYARAKVQLYKLLNDETR